MRRLAVPLFLVHAACPWGFGQVYEVWTTSDLTLQLKAPRAEGEVLFWSKSEGWERPAFEWKDDRVRCTLSLDRMTHGRTTLLVGRPANVDIDDRQPPKIAVSLDGTPVTDQRPAVVSKPPTRLRCTIEDARNAVDPETLKVLLNGLEIATEAAEPATRKQLIVRAALPPVEFGDHTLTVKASDVSPFRNASKRLVQFSYVVGADLALASSGAKVEADSCYPNYAAHPLIDGDWKSCATSGSPDVTWASAETEADHWVVITWPKPQSVGSVSLFWVRSDPSQLVLVQTPRGKEWATVGSAKPKSPRAATTVRFPQTSVKALRILQPRGSGLANRPNLLWLGEIVVTGP